MISYEAWNEAIASAVFPPLETAAPVFLTLDEAALKGMALAVGSRPELVEQELARCVRDELQRFGGPTSYFRRINDRLEKWWDEGFYDLEAPPVLPVLTVLCMAAARMAESPEMSTTNFYGRVGEVLDISSRIEAFATAYRSVAEDWWFSLERWLDSQDGQRGLPTAVAVGHRYVGLPISQVLVRASDRERLADYFALEGLAPRAAVPGHELDPSFGMWMESPECTVSKLLHAHWHRDAAKPRILDVVAATLANWDGVILGHEGRKSARAVLTLRIGSFPRRGIRLLPAAYLTSAGEGRTGAINSSSGWVDVELAPVAPGLVTIGHAESLDGNSLLEGVIRVRDPLTDLEIIRRPRRLCIFRKHDQLGWIEAERTMLGEDLILVIRDDERFLTRVLKVLQDSARPGWRELDSSMAGHPDGWRIIDGVQLLRAPDVRREDLDMGALLPLAKTQMTVSGGFALPGSVAGKWHRRALPEVRVVSNDDRGFSIRLIAFGADGAGQSRTTVQELSSPGAGALVLTLSELNLEDGNYRAELVDSEGQVTTSTSIRVRSSETPDTKQREDSSAADQFVMDPMCVVYASSPVDGGSISGAVVRDADPFEAQSAEISQDIHWQTTRSKRAKLKVTIERIAPDSCVYTGRHHTKVDQVPLNKWGYPLTPYVDSECELCHLRRRYPTRNRQRRSDQAQSPVPRKPQAISAPAVSRHDGSWNTVLDAVRHCGAGTMISLGRLASFADAGALTLDHVQRTFSSLGYIDLLRDPETLEMVGWDSAPTALIETPLGWFLSGLWTESLIATVRASSPHLNIKKVLHPESPDSHFFSHRPDVAREDIFVVEDRLALALELPVLSEVVGSLPRVPTMRIADGLSHFNPDTAKWGAATGMGALGGYRLRGFSTNDFLRSETDLDNDTMARSVVQLSKHATALLWGRRPLIAYDPREEILRVPLGANLPGLYERAVVCSSGVAPVVGSGCLEYRFVTRDVAEHVSYLLMN